MKFKIALAIIILSCQSFAGGTDYNSIFGSRTSALNGMYFAGSAGIGSILTNPAGLAESGIIGIEFSAIDRTLQYEFESSNQESHRSYRDDNLSFGGGLFWKAADDITIGAAYHPVIDYGVDWPYVTQRTSDSASSVLAFSMLNRLTVNSISPSAAFSFGAFTLGVTANIYEVKQQVSFPQGNPEWENGTGLASYQFSYNLNGWSFGGTLGLLYDLNEDLRFGASIKSGFKAKIKGDAVSSLFSDLDSGATPSEVDVSTELEIPWKIGIGALYQLSDELKINLDAGYSLWGSTSETLDYTFSNAVWQEGTSEIDATTGITASSFILEYENTFDFGIGIEYGMLPEVVYRAGYRYSQTPNSESTYNFLFPGVDTHSLSAGIAYRSENMLLEGSLVYNMGIEREVNKTSDNLHSGLYSTNGLIPTITLSISL